MPQETLHYIGDTHHLPYGAKTTKELCGYIQQVVNFCLYKHYKLLVIACNTATAAACYFLPSYLKQIDHEMRIINVIDPIVTYSTSVQTQKHIGLIGTKYTVEYGTYAQRFRAANITLSVLATPLLASMVETCFCNGKVDKLLLHNYLRQLPQTIDAFIPACTHYIFLEKEFKIFFKDHCQKEIEVIDPAHLTALAVEKFLRSHDLLNNTVQKLPDCFMATELTTAFKNASKQLFGQTPIEIDLNPYSKSLL